MKVDDALGLREWNEYIAATAKAKELAEDKSVSLQTRCEAHLAAHRAYTKFTAAITASDRAAKARVYVDGVFLFAAILTYIGLIVPEMGRVPGWGVFATGALASAALVAWAIVWVKRYRAVHR